MPKPLEIKERICKKISDTLVEIVRDGKLAKPISGSPGIFIPDNTKSQLIGFLADELIAEKEILDAISQSDLERAIFDALIAARNKQSMQDQAAYAAKLILAHRSVNKP